jgi:peptidoglycan/xylan/chitin deacetylase (PgdA/CDA1 family)
MARSLATTKTKDMMSKVLRRTQALKFALALAVMTVVLLATTALASAVTIVSFSFDDGLSSAPVAGSVMSAFGLKASFFIITGKVGESGFVTWENVATLAAEGQEIGAHTVNHEDLAELTPEEQHHQICGSREALEEHGYHPLSFAYPNGAFNAETLRITKECGFTSARLFGDYQGPNGPEPSEDTKIYPEPFSIPDPFELSTQGSPETPVKLEELEDDYEWGVGGWVIIAVHGICPSMATPNESECAGLYGPTSQTILEEYLTWISHKPETIVRTIGQVVNDKTSPVTTINCNGVACDSPYPSAVTVTLAATDAESAVASTHYTTNGSEPTTSSPEYTGSFQVSSTTTVKFRSWDVRGNEETVHSQTITIDTPPVTTIESKPSNPSNETKPSFTFSANKTSTFKCSLDGGAETTCSSPYTTPTLTQGSHTLTIAATDSAGSRETDPPSYTWTVDTTPPVTTIESKPALDANSTEAKFVFKASESATFECKLDGGVFKSCSSPDTVSGLGQGSHTFEVRATDLAGNKELTPQSYTWTVDTVPPVTTIESEPSAETNSTEAKFSFKADESATFECKLDGGVFKSCSSPDTLSGLAQGSHTFEVRATDTAGNREATPQSYTWKVNTALPVTTIESEPAGDSNSTEAKFSFKADEPATFECKLDGGAFKSCSSPDTLSGLAQGSHTFEVRATDTVGNKEASAQSYTWMVDTVPPVTTIESEPPIETNSDKATFAFKASESAIFECRLDGGAFKACSSPDVLSGLSDGSHTFEVRATDTAGNKETAPPSYTWTVDATPPVTTIESPPLGETIGTGVSIVFSADEPATFECSLDGGAYTACTSPYVASGLSVGVHTLRVIATDLVGNVELEPATCSWIVIAQSQEPPPTSHGSVPAPTPTPTPMPTPTPIPAPAPSHIPPRLVLARRAGGEALRRGLPVGLYCPGPCSATIVVRAPVASTATHRRQVRTRALASVHSNASRAGTLDLRVKLTNDRWAPTGNGKLRTVPLTVLVTVHMEGGGSYELRGVVTLQARLGALHWV